MTMFALSLMLLQAVEGLPVAPLPAQALPARGCAAYLFSRGEKPVFIAMAGADPAQLRLRLDGAVIDLPRTAQVGTGQVGGGGFGFAGVTDYAAGNVTVVLDMTIEQRADVKDGAAIGPATLRIDRAGQDGVVLPVGGIIGCAATPR